MQMDQSALRTVTAAPTAEDAVHPIVRAAFRNLNQARVRWVLLRGAADLARPSGDVDLLVDAAALPRLDEVLGAAGLRRLGLRGHGSHRSYFAYDADEDLWIKLDVVSRIEFGAWQHLRSPLATACLTRRRPAGDLWRLPPEDEAWLLLLHLLLDKGRVADDRRDLAVQATKLATDESPVAAFLERDLAPGCSQRVLSTVAAGTQPAIEALAAALTRQWVRRDPVRSRAARLATRVARRLEIPVAPHPRGFAVALVGPDGAGKTTLAEAVRRSVPVPSRYVYMGLWQESRWDDVLSRLPAGRVGQRTARVLRSSLAVRWHCARGRLVLLDRFAQDALLPGGADTSRGGRLNLELSLRLTPQPRLVLLLDAPGSLMFARKGEHTPELLEDRRQAYLRLVADLPHAAVLDATHPAVEVARGALAAIWDAVDQVPARVRPAGPR
jgi:thymidylate kinase